MMSEYTRDPQHLLELSKMELAAIFDSLKDTKCPPVDKSGFEIAMNFWSSKWKIPVYTRLIRFEHLRYGEIKKMLSDFGITNHSLSKTLQEMETDKLIVRKSYNEIPPHVEYSLTDSARKFLPIMLQVSAWARMQAEILQDSK